MNKDAYLLGASSQSATLKVDRDKGEIYDLVLMKGNREAAGHGIYADAKTIETAFQAMKNNGGQIKAYYTHNHAGAASWSVPYADTKTDDELETIGYFSEPRVEDDNLIAGKFTVYESWRQDNEKRFNRIFEIAEKTPRLIALSVEVWGDGIYVGKDKKEYTEKPKGVELEYGGMTVLRVNSLFAAAFVADGALTDGLFSKFCKWLGMGDKKKLSPAPSTEAVTETTKSNNQMITEIKARFGADEVRLGRALVLHANDNTLTLDAIASKLEAQDRENLQKEITTLKAQVETLKTEHATALAAKEAEIAALKAKLSKETGGHDTEVNLGAEGAAMPNPWAKETKNLTEQCRILKENPTLAKALKKAAGVE